MDQPFGPIEPAGADTNGVTEISSMCPRCEGNGLTKMMFTLVPHFREVILSSFECEEEDCGEKNTHVQFGGQLQEAGCICELRVSEAEDMDRQIIRSESCTVSIPELDLQAPPTEGTLSTVEGCLSRIITGLGQHQEVRKITAPELHAQIEAFIARVEGLKAGKEPFTLRLTDPAGNSHIQPLVGHTFSADHPDPRLTVRHYQRSRQDDITLGLVAPDDGEEEGGAVEGGGTAGDDVMSTGADTGVVGLERAAPAADYSTRRTEAQEHQVDEGTVPLTDELPETCYACKAAGILRICQVKLPYFEDTVIMSFLCDQCGYKTNEVKSGGAIPDYGTRITLECTDIADLSRDVLKSTSCCLTIPQLEFEVTEGSGGRFSTVEGVLSQVKEQLDGVSATNFALGDSSAAGDKARMEGFLETLEGMKSGDRPFTLILDDPLSHSYVQALTEVPEDDKRLVVVRYTRTAEQEEDFSLDILKAQDEEFAAAAAAATSTDEASPASDPPPAATGAAVDAPGGHTEEPAVA